MLYVGSGVNLSFVLHTAFSDRHSEQELASCNIWRAGELAEAHESDVDVVVVDVPWPYEVGFANDRYVVEVPSWVRQSLRLEGKWDDWLGSLRRSIRGKQLRRIRKHGLTAVETREPAAIDAFYRTMYAPHTRRRYGSSASVASRANVAKCVRRGTLLQVLRGGEAVAATVLCANDGALQSLYNGFADADFRRLTGVSSALYYYSIAYAFENGYDEIDFGGSRPLLDDGVFELKRRWGARVDDDWSLETLLLGFNCFSEGVEALLRHCPWIVRVDSELVGKLVVADAPLTAAAVARAIRCLASPGLDGLNIYGRQGVEDGAFEAADSSAVRVKIFDLTQSDDPLSIYCNGVGPAQDTDAAGKLGEMGDFSRANRTF